MASESRVSFILDNVKDGIGNVRMRVRLDDGLVSLNVGYRAEVSKWEGSLQLCKPNTYHGKKKVPASVINKEIRRYGDVAQSVLDSFPRNSVDKELFRMSLRERLGRKASQKSESVLPSFRSFVVRMVSEGAWSEHTAMLYMSVIKSLASFRNLKASEVGEDFLNEYKMYLVASGKNNTTILAYMQLVQSLLKRCGYLDKSIKVSLRTNEKPVVWLTWEELMRLYSADLSSLLERYEHAEVARDYLCLSSFTSLRVSDCLALTKPACEGNFIRVVTRKTDAPISIDKNKYSSSILDKYKGLDGEYAMPRIERSQLTRTIKYISRELGFNSLITISKYVGGKRIEYVKEKWELLSMHSGRRTFICNALSMGIPPNIVMKWTGHKSYEEMRPYIDIADKAKEEAMSLFDTHK